MGPPAERSRDRNEKRGTGEGGRLRKESPFICKVEYKTRLPRVPLDIDAKLIKPPAAHPRNFVDYQVTSLDALYHCEPAIGADMGLFLDTITPSSMRTHAGEVDSMPLRNGDALLMSDELPRRKFGSRPTARGAKGPTWYLKTSYLTPEGAVGDIRSSVKEEDAAYGSQDESVADTFVTASQSPVHPRRPGLKATKIVPIVSMGSDGVSRMHVQFDFKPILRRPQAKSDDIDSVPETNASCRGIIKGFPGVEERSIVSAFLSRASDTEYLESREGHSSTLYEWKSDFTEDKKATDDNLCIILGESKTGPQQFVPSLFSVLPTKAVMKKRKIEEREKEAGGIRKPIAITATKL